MSVSRWLFKGYKRAANIRIPKAQSTCKNRLCATSSVERLVNVDVTGEWKWTVTETVNSMHIEYTRYNRGSFHVRYTKWSYRSHRVQIVTQTFQAIGVKFTLGFCFSCSDLMPLTADSSLPSPSRKLDWAHVHFWVRRRAWESAKSEQLLWVFSV